MNKLKKVMCVLGAASALALGGTGVSAITTSDSAQAYTVRTTGWTTTCIGPNLWNVRIDYIDYSWWEEVTYPWPKDHYRYTATSLNQYNNKYCMGTTYA